MSWWSASGALLRHHVVGRIHGAHADLCAPEKVHSGDGYGPEHPAPVLVVGRWLLVPLDVRKAPAVAPIKRHLTPDDLPATPCRCSAGMAECLQASLSPNVCLPTSTAYFWTHGPVLDDTHDVASAVWHLNSDPHSWMLLCPQVDHPQQACACLCLLGSLTTVGIAPEGVRLLGQWH